MNTEQTSKNIFTYIKTHYGETILAKIRKLEKTKIKYSSYTNHLRFSLRCHHNKILPKDLQLKSRIKTERSKIILQRAGKLLLQERIHINHVIRDRLKNGIEQLKGKILESITPEEFHLVEKIHENSYKKSFELTKKRHIRKFDELISKNRIRQSATNIADKKKWVINMSSRQLTHIETDLFTKGLNFSITSKTLPNKDIIATIEDAVKDLEKEEADTIRAKVSLTLLNSKPPKDNLSKDERKALKELQSDTSIVILPTDKGRSTVILNREDYLEKCMDHINNGPYQLLKKDPTTKIKAKTLKQLKVLKDNEFIDNKLYYYLKPTDSPAPRFYGQPKIHKPGVPIRPIVSYSGSPLYNLNKYIANILKTYVKHENNNAKNSTTFSNYIRNVPIEDDEIMVSFDVTSLYTNIPIIDTLNIIKDYVHSDDQFARKTAISQDKFLDLVNLVLTTTWYTFNSQFYQQTDGVAMGGPASSTTAEIYMQAHESTAISTALHPPKVWERSVDDVYSIVKRTQLENFFHHINNLHQNIKFTMEEESNGELAFLDTSDEHKRSVGNCDCDKNEIAKHCWEADHNFNWDQKKVVDRESRLIPRKIKETIHSLKNPNHIKKISYMLPEIWLPNLR